MVDKEWHEGNRMRILNNSLDTHDKKKEDILRLNKYIYIYI